MDRHKSGSAARFSQAFDRLVTVHQLRLLVEVIDRGGFSRAAEALGLSPPAISHQMRGLSTSVGPPPPAARFPPADRAPPAPPPPRRGGGARGPRAGLAAEPFIGREPGSGTRE